MDGTQAEQKHLAEEKKLEEFKNHIQEEREYQEFRLLQEQAGLVPKQERWELLYDSRLAVGKSSAEGFKTLEIETLPPAAGTSKDASIEQEALARIKNNPIKMDAIKRSMEDEKQKRKKRHEHKQSGYGGHSRDEVGPKTDDGLNCQGIA